MLVSRPARLIGAIFALATLFCHLGFAEPLPDQAAVFREIEKAAQRTMVRLAEEPVTWTTLIERGQPEVFVKVKWSQSPSGRAVSAFIEAKGKSVELVRILEKDGFWYVNEFGRSYKTRPYEAILRLPSIYRFLEQSDLRLFGELNGGDQLGSLKAVEDGIAVFQTPLPLDQVTKTQAILDAIKNDRESGEGDIESLQEQLDATKKVLERGMLTAINLKHGYLAASGIPGQRRIVEDFEWLDLLDDRFFQVDLSEWEDETDQLAIDPASRDDLAMFGYCRECKPDGPTDADAVLVNVKSGVARRIPYNSGVCWVGCFSPDRSKAYVSGMVADEGKAAIFEIDLLSGQNRRVTDSTAQGLQLYLTLSPDGSRLAFIEAAPGSNAAPGDKSVDGLRKSRIVLVDVETGAAKPAGEPLDTSYLSWLPSGDGLLLIKRENAQRGRPRRASLAVLSLDGAVKVLRPGTSPQLIRGGAEILYKDEEQDRWFTCDLNGENPHMFGDGLPGFEYPAASPSGDRLIMMRFGDEGGPRPHLIDLQTGKATPIPVEDGLWMMPVWR